MFDKHDNRLTTFHTQLTRLPKIRRRSKIRHKDRAHMRPFFEQCVESCLTLTQKSIDTLKPAKTPSLDESKLDSTADDTP